MTEPIIDNEFRELIPPLTPEEYASLEASILAEGVREPLLVWAEEDILIDGHHRLKICQKHGIPYQVRQINLASRAEALLWGIRNQLARRNLTMFQRAELSLREEGLIRERAKQNQGTRTDLCQNSDKSFVPVDTKKEIARQAGVSHDTIHKAKVIMDKAPEELKEQARRGEVSINQAYKTIRSAEKAEAKAAIVEKISNEPPPLPEGPFRVIVIDPPWPYESRAVDPTHRARNPYPSMSLGDIADLPVASLSHEDCILWLWTTNAFLDEAFNLVYLWGFQQKTMMTWGKDRTGLGNWLRGQTEHCILAVKGSPVVDLKNQSTLLLAPVREHSRKPDEFYALVDSLCPGSKLEMFARQQREGWQAWGAELENRKPSARDWPSLKEAPTGLRHQRATGTISEDNCKSCEHYRQGWCWLAAEKISTMRDCPKDEPEY